VIRLGFLTKRQQILCIMVSEAFMRRYARYMEGLLLYGTAAMEVTPEPGDLVLVPYRPRLP
jgi:hypothetical protein